MTRDITASIQAELLKSTVKSAILVQIESGGGDVLVWSGLGDLTWDSKTFIGVGEFGGITEIKETENVEATGIQFKLSGVSATNISLVLSDIKQGKPANVWLAFFNSSGAIIADPAKMFSGLVDVPEIEDTGETVSISISAESSLIRLEIPQNRRYTPEDQKLIDATDKGFDFVAGLQDKKIVIVTSR